MSQNLNMRQNMSEMCERRRQTHVTHNQLNEILHMSCHGRDEISDGWIWDE
jgi:hypothetical protein